MSFIWVVLYRICSTISTVHFRLEMVMQQTCLSRNQQPGTTIHSSKDILLNSFIPNLTAQTFVSCLPISGGKFAAISCSPGHIDNRISGYAYVILATIHRFPYLPISFKEMYCSMHLASLPSTHTRKLCSHICIYS